MMKTSFILAGALFFLISGFLPQAADAGIYKWTDPSGRVHFSDTPPTEESVDLKEIQSDEPPPTSDRKTGTQPSGLPGGPQPNPGMSGEFQPNPGLPGGPQPNPGMSGEFQPNPGLPGGSQPNPGVQKPPAPDTVRRVEFNPERQEIRARIGELLARRNALEERIGGLPTAARAEREVLSQELEEVRKELSTQQNKLVKMNNPGTPTPAAPPGK
ncbi:MAG: DUF4124 domain-containing protein [Deltaproteobacteria bacterium]|nr:DUF4124 domain-containing protein [Deltaproteobacteria bacterium]